VFKSPLFEEIVSSKKFTFAFSKIAESFWFLIFCQA